ncbi:MAG: hypothetical protein WDO24_14485 [Pseudomonadota bacterium]
MKLFWSSRSPFVRKVMIAAHETGLAPAARADPGRGRGGPAQRGRDGDQPAQQDPDPGDRRRHGAVRFDGDLRVSRQSP